MPCIPVAADTTISPCMAKGGGEGGSSSGECLVSMDNPSFFYGRSISSQNHDAFIP